MLTNTGSSTGGVSRATNNSGLGQRANGSGSGQRAPPNVTQTSKPSTSEDAYVGKEPMFDGTNKGDDEV